MKKTALQFQEKKEKKLKKKKETRIKMKRSGKRELIAGTGAVPEKQKKDISPGIERVLVLSRLAADAMTCSLAKMNRALPWKVIWWKSRFSGHVVFAEKAKAKLSKFWSVHPVKYWHV